jgi:hypothetical protein
LNQTDTVVASSDDGVVKKCGAKLPAPACPLASVDDYRDRSKDELVDDDDEKESADGEIIEQFKSFDEMQLSDDLLRGICK